MDNKTKNYQASRMREASCGRSLTPPCRVACPLHMEIGEYVDLVAQGKVMEALQVIREGNPFPSVCAYICTAPCETMCRRGQVDEPVAIRALKRFAVEFGGDRMIQLEAEKRHEERIAVVGSGPAGLACAYYLRKLGYPVTIFEAYSEPGGMLRVGIPKYHLPREVLDTEVQRLIQMGVEIRTNTKVRSIEVLLECGYQAILFAIGSPQIVRKGELVSAISGCPDPLKEFKLETIKLDGQRVLKVDPATLATPREGVFAAGDVIAGPTSVVQALTSGRQAAFCIDDYLQHRPLSISKGEKEIRTGNLFPTTVEVIRKHNRFEPPIPSPEAGAQEFELVELVYDWGSAINEARRCLRCGMGAEILFQDKCATCLTCLRVCPYHVPYLDDGGTIQIPADQCQACGICVAECPAKAIVLRKPYDRRHIDEELEHALKSAAESKSKPLIIGFCCQYGLFGTGALASMWRGGKAGIWIVPVLCVAKLEEGHVLRAFEMGAEGVFIAGCGEQCSRENTAFWVLQRAERVRKALFQIGLEPERLRTFNLRATDGEAAEALDNFTEQIGGLCLASVIKQEVRS